MLLQSMAKLWIDYSAFIISTQIKSIFFFFLLFFFWYHCGSHWLKKNNYEL